MGGGFPSSSFRVSMFPSIQVSKFPSIQGGREAGRQGGPMRGLGTDHAISGLMRGLKKMHLMAQTDKLTNKLTDGNRNSMTESAQWGRFSKNYVGCFLGFVICPFFWFTFFVVAKTSCVVQSFFTCINYPYYARSAITYKNIFC